jgi:hypothetical protein
VKIWEIAKAISSAVTFDSPGEGHSRARRGVIEIFCGALGSTPRAMTSSIYVEFLIEKLQKSFTPEFNVRNLSHLIVVELLSLRIKAEIATQVIFGSPFRASVISSRVDSLAEHSVLAAGQLDFAGILPDI